jgi:hypothetical protein
MSTGSVYMWSGGCESCGWEDGVQRAPSPTCSATEIVSTPYRNHVKDLGRAYGVVLNLSRCIALPRTCTDLEFGPGISRSISGSGQTRPSDAGGCALRSIDRISNMTKSDIFRIWRRDDVESPGHATLSTFFHCPGFRTHCCHGLPRLALAHGVR